MTGTPRKKLLYTFNSDNWESAVPVAELICTEHSPGRYEIIRIPGNKIIIPYGHHISNNDGFVFFGPQTSKRNPGFAVFPDYRMYFDFLRDLRRANKKLLAVASKDLILPGEELMAGVLRYDKDDTSESVAADIVRFFDNEI